MRAAGNRYHVFSVARVGTYCCTGSRNSTSVFGRILSWAGSLQAWDRNLSLTEW